MANDEQPKVRRTLQLRFTMPAADSTQFVAMIKAAAPFYQMFGKAEVRLLQNVDDPAKFIQVIEYEADPGLGAQPATHRQRRADAGLSANLAHDVSRRAGDRRVSGGVRLTAAGDESSIPYGNFLGRVSGVKAAT